jgi:hypothetical protein
MASLNTGQPPGFITEVHNGLLSAVYVFHHFIACFWVPSALLIFALGLGATLVDAGEAWSHWSWWRVYGVYFVIFVAPFIEYWLYQERKIAFSSSSTGVSTYGRAQSNFIFFIYMVVLVIAASWLSVLVIWMGTTDFQTCAASPLCSGPKLLTRPCPGAIMVLTAMCVLAATFWVLILFGIFVHAAARDVFLSRASSYFNSFQGGFMPMADEIVMGDHVTPGELDPETTLRRRQPIAVTTTTAAAPMSGIPPGHISMVGGVLVGAAPRR